MKRRTLVIRIGDHWFLRHVRDLYETLTSKYTTKDQPRGIVSVFPSHIPSPFWFRKGETHEVGYTNYLKDKETKKALSEKMDNQTELKVYIAGHCDMGSNKLASLETTTELQFTIHVQTIARMLDNTLKMVGVVATAAQPVKISLICCYAASGNAEGKKSAFAARLLEELNKLGHDHILVKARALSVSAPFFGKKHTEGKKEHFYLAGNQIYHVEKDNDLRKQVLKVFKQCHSSTSVSTKSCYLWQCLKDIGNLGYSDTEQKTALLAIINKALKSEEVKLYRYGTGWFMRLFGIKSNTEKQLDILQNKLSKEAIIPTYTKL